MTTVPGDFAGAAALLDAARTPSDVFGTDSTAANRIYRELAKLVHPDRVTGPDAVRANAVFEQLNALWTRFSGPTVTIASKRHNYTVGSIVARGDLANLYGATISDPTATHSDVVLKVGRDPQCNDLLAAEAHALKRIATRGDEKYRGYVPTLLESFTYREPVTGIDRKANVLVRAEGFVSLAEVRTAYPDGLDPRDAAWMWRRLLVALGYAHQAGVIHGAVLPEHVLIHPAEHGLMLIDWCYSAIDGGLIPALVPGYTGWYPREVANGERPGPGTDIFLATGCIVALVGDRMPDALARFARGCTLAPLTARPDDAWKLLAELDEVLQKLYGKRVFRPFTMPAIN